MLIGASLLDVIPRSSLLGVQYSIMKSLRFRLLICGYMWVVCSVRKVGSEYLDSSPPTAVMSSRRLVVPYILENKQFYIWFCAAGIV